MTTRGNNGRWQSIWAETAKCYCWRGTLKWCGNHWRMVFLPPKFWCTATFKNCECGNGYRS